MFDNKQVIFGRVASVSEQDENYFFRGKGRGNDGEAAWVDVCGKNKVDRN